MAPSIQPVTKDIWRELTNLKVRADQDSFVASNVRSIAEARFLDEDEDRRYQWHSYDFGVYEDETPVGYFLYQCNFDHPETQAYILDGEMQALLRLRE